MNHAWSLRGSAVYWILAAAPVVAVFALPEFVVQDGGLHLSSAAALEGLLAGRWPELLTWRPGLPPNLTVELTVLALSQVIDPGWVIRLVVAAALLGFAAAAAGLAHAVGAPPWQAVLLLPFAANYPLLLGLIGFSVAVVLALAALVPVLRRPSAPPRLVLAVLLVLTWLTHVVPALIAALVTACVVWCARIAEADGPPVRRAALGAFGAARHLWLPLLPVALLSAVFVVTGDDQRGLGHRAYSVAGAAVQVGGMTMATVAHVRAEFWLFRLLALVLVAACVARLWQRWRGRSGRLPATGAPHAADDLRATGELPAMGAPHATGGLHAVGELRATGGLRATDGLLLAAALLAVAAVVLPEGLAGGQGFLATRVSLFVPVLMVAWLIADRTTDWTVRIAAVVAGVVTVALTVVRLPAMVPLGEDLADLRTLAPCVPQGATVVQLNLDVGASRSVRMVPMVEQSGLIAAERDLLDLGNESGWHSYYLWAFRDRARADRLLMTEPGGVDLVPPRVGLTAALDRGFPLDAVILYGRRDAEPDVLADPHTAAVLADLDRAFARTAVSDRGAAELWLRRGVASGCPS